MNFKELLHFFLLFLSTKQKKYRDINNENLCIYTFLRNMLCIVCVCGCVCVHRWVSDGWRMLILTVTVSHGHDILPEKAPFFLKHLWIVRIIYPVTDSCHTAPQKSWVLRQNAGTSWVVSRRSVVMESVLIM